MNLVETKDVSVKFDDRFVLSHMDFTIEAGEIVTIVGPNGSGKSTFVQVITGSVQPNEGQVIRAQGLRLGYVPQRLFIDRTLPITVARFLRLATRASAIQISKMLKRTGLQGLGHQQMSSLSGGQQQRATLARALLMEPQLLLLDEPTQGLDQPGAAAFYHLIEEVRTDLGCAVLMVSHDLHVVMSASDRVICLNGHICCQGAPSVVSTAPEYRALFGDGTKGALALYKHEHDHSHHDPSHHHHDPSAEPHTHA
jgi:zinc transport system ATP-binding protein